MRIGIYARISTSDQQTIPMQVRALEEYAQTRHWRITHPVTEVASGAKNRPKREEHVPPRTVDLTGLCQNARCEIISTLPIFKLITSYSDRAPKYSKAEELVVGLRHGDTVVVGLDKIKLGTFLGAGNASHVFEMADNDKEVVRFPFMSWHVAASGNGSEIMPSFFFEHLVISEKLLPPELPRAKILKHGSQFEYIISEKIDGQEQGLSFIEKLKQKYRVEGEAFRIKNGREEYNLKRNYELLAEETKHDLKFLDSLLNKPLDSIERKQVVGLRATLKTLAEAYDTAPDRAKHLVAELTAQRTMLLQSFKYDKVDALSKEIEGIETAVDMLTPIGRSLRQFLWDRQREEWVLVDW